MRAARYVAGAADKNGKITADLVQYFNRILKITLTTTTTKATLARLSALIRLEDGVTIVDATPGLPAPADEEFVDFSALEYEADDIRQETVTIVKPNGPGDWVEDHAMPIKGWLDAKNGEPSGPVPSLPGFIYAASDGLRTIQFIHNYATPAALWAFPPIQD